MHKRTRLFLCFLILSWLFNIFSLSLLIIWLCTDNCKANYFRGGKAGRQIRQWFRNKQENGVMWLSPLGGMYSRSVDWDSLLSTWRVNKAHQECVLKSFPPLGADAEPRQSTLHKVHMCTPLWEFCSEAAPALGLGPCSGPGLCWGHWGLYRGSLGACPQEYQKGRCPLEKTDHSSFRVRGNWILC